MPSPTDLKQRVRCDMFVIPAYPISIDSGRRCRGSKDKYTADEFRGKIIYVHELREMVKYNSGECAMIGDNLGAGLDIMGSMLMAVMVFCTFSLHTILMINCLVLQNPMIYYTNHKRCLCTCMSVALRTNN